MKLVVEEFYGSRRTGDLALFYYSGHGIQHDDRQSLFFGTIDTDTTFLHTTAFDVEGVLRHLLNHTKASQKVILLDCCFSGSFTARHRFSGGVRQEPRRLKRERGTFMLQSSSHLKASKAQGPDRPSAFTDVLLAGLRGAAQATAEDGWITASDLSRYAMTEMARRREEKPVESSEGVTDPIPLVAGQGERPQRRLNVRTEEPDDAPFDTDRWRRLLSYYVDCLQRSAILQFFVNLADKDSYLAAPAGREIMLSATEPIPLKDRGRQLANLAEDGGRSLQYGYPVVALQQVGKQQVRLAPLLVSDLTVGDDGLAHPAPPQPSPALIDHFQLAAVEAGELRQAVAELLGPGDRGSLALPTRRCALAPREGGSCLPIATCDTPSRRAISDCDRGLVGPSANSRSIASRAQLVRPGCVGAKGRPSSVRYNSPWKKTTASSIAAYEIRRSRSAARSKARPARAITKSSPSTCGRSVATARSISRGLGEWRSSNTWRRDISDQMCTFVHEGSAVREPGGTRRRGRGESPLAFGP